MIDSLTALADLEDRLSKAITTGEELREKYIRTALRPDGSTDHSSSGWWESNRMSGKIDGFKVARGYLQESVSLLLSEEGNVT